MTEPTTTPDPAADRPKGFQALTAIDQQQLRAIYEAARAELGKTAKVDVSLRQGGKLSIRLHWIDPEVSLAPQMATKVITELDLEAVMAERPVDGPTVIEALCTLVRDWSAESRKAHRRPL